MSKLTKTLVIGGVLALVPFGCAALLDTPTARTATSASASELVPEEYRQLVNEAGQACDGITPGLIAAQINQESRWNPNAGSDQGAQGISQFMPGTWATAGMDANGDGIANVWDPEDAIPSQARYLCSQLDAVNAAIDSGQLPADSDPTKLALAAYNAGLGAVLDAGGIPNFEETIDYVDVITSTTADYETATTVTTTTEVAASGDVAEALEWAKSVADSGTPYVWGGEGGAWGGYDCSGLAQATMRRLGIELPHLADAQARDPQGVDVPLESLQPGDLIFWGNDTRYYHVAIYYGDGMMVSADDPGINFEPIYGTPAKARRFL